MTTDRHRSQVYEAEQFVQRMFDRADSTGLRTVAALGSQLTLPIERRFASVESVQDYVDRVLALNWVQAGFDRAAVPVRVRSRRGGGRAHYERVSATIAVPLHDGWALREFVVLHELVHHLEPDRYPAASHGPEYCRRYLELVDGIIGAEAALLLRAGLDNEGGIRGTFQV